MGFAYFRLGFAISKSRVLYLNATSTLREFLNTILKRDLEIAKPGFGAKRDLEIAKLGFGAKRDLEIAKPG